MKKYFIDGEQVKEKEAEHAFLRAHVEGGIEQSEVADMWEQCQMSEEARDDWLVAGIEIVFD